MIVANWKCNGSKAMINEWTNNFLTNYVEMKKSFIGIAPPSIYIESILDTKLSKFEEINEFFSYFVRYSWTSSTKGQDTG